MASLHSHTQQLLLLLLLKFNIHSFTTAECQIQLSSGPAECTEFTFQQIYLGKTNSYPTTYHFPIFEAKRWQYVGKLLFEYQDFDLLEIIAVAI